MSKRKAKATRRCVDHWNPVERVMNLHLMLSSVLRLLGFPFVLFLWPSEACRLLFPSLPCRTVPYRDYSPMDGAFSFGIGFCTFCFSSFMSYISIFTMLNQVVPSPFCPIVFQSFLDHYIKGCFMTGWERDAQVVPTSSSSSSSSN